MNFLSQVYNFNFTNLNSLECGSHKDGNETSMLRSSNNCYYIDANPKDYTQMLKQTNVDKNNIFNFALSDKCGTVSFNVTSWEGNSSIEHSTLHKQELLRYGSTFNTITVPCFTYEYFINNIIKKPIDILVLDIEGHECNVLNTFFSLSTEQLPKIICIEAGYNWDERKQLLLNLGYILDYYAYNNAILSHTSFTVEKNIEKLKEINKKYPHFIWHNNVIFVNDAEHR